MALGSSAGRGGRGLGFGTAGWIAEHPSYETSKGTLTDKERGVEEIESNDPLYRDGIRIHWKETPLKCLANKRQAVSGGVGRTCLGR
jgi:hypothetical protein